MAKKFVEEEMHRYFMRLNADEKKSVLNMIKAFVKGKNKRKARISIEQYNRELEEAERRIENGEFITQEELEKEMKTW